MQVIMHVVVKSSCPLRQNIIDDEDGRNGCGLDGVSERKKSGWAKITASKTKSCPGVLRIRWDTQSKTLSVRVVKRGGSPDELLGRFVNYLSQHHAEELAAVTMVWTASSSNSDESEEDDGEVELKKGMPVEFRHQRKTVTGKIDEDSDTVDVKLDGGGMAKGVDIEKSGMTVL